MHFVTLFPDTRTIVPVTAASAALRIFPEVKDLLKTVRKGNAYFIHLLIPHGPFVFNSNCDYVGESQNILEDYQQQAQCSQKLIDSLLLSLSANPTTSNSIIIIHGDHGLRLFGINTKNEKFLTNKNIKRTFGVFFAVKSPLLKQGYDTHQLPLDYLLKNIISHTPPISPYNKNRQYVLFRDEISLKLLGQHPLIL